MITQEKRKIQETAALAQSTQQYMPALSNPHGSVSFQATKDTKKVPVDDMFPERTVTISVGLTDKYESELVIFLRENRDIFAWST